MIRALLLAVGVSACASTALSQSINIQFGGAGASTLDAGYGAAGPTGYWNLTNASSPAFLRGLDGTLTGVSNFVTEDFGPLGTGLPTGPTGNDALLLSSFYRAPVVGERFVTISGLANGQYNVIFYGLNDGAPMTHFFAGSNHAVLAGGWPGQFAPGVYATLPFEVTSGTMTFSVAGGFEDSRWSGMQIVQVPGPGVFGTVAMGLVVAARRRRR